MMTEGILTGLLKNLIQLAMPNFLNLCFKKITLTPCVE